MAETRLLIIDDEAAFLSTLKRRLVKRNMTVVSASSGEEGLKKLLETPDIDIVVLDIRLPGMDGIQTLREIKRAHASVEVILLSGHATFESAIKGMTSGAFDYLMKPCDFEELLAKVDEATAKRRRRLASAIETNGRAAPKRQTV